MSRDLGLFGNIISSGVVLRIELRLRRFSSRKFRSWGARRDLTRVGVNRRSNLALTHF